RRSISHALEEGRMAWRAVELPVPQGGELTMSLDSSQAGARQTGAIAVPRGWRAAAIAALTVVSSVAPVLAQQPRTVSGTVVSAATLTPIQGADVRVQGTETGVLTDVSGRFRIADVGADQVTIVVRRIRFQPVTQTVRAGATDVRLLMTEA